MSLCLKDYQPLMAAAPPLMMLMPTPPMPTPLSFMLMLRDAAAAARLYAVTSLVVTSDAIVYATPRVYAKTLPFMAPRHMSVFRQSAFAR